ncbi:MAG: metal-sensitive transcriptional regulator [Gemmatimonadales bacterium]|nr:metal-sensitive transcriptional regulator [Gemmatimonadales bacterium]
MTREPKGRRVTAHPEHSKQLPSLNRVAGQIEGVKRMIEERRCCPEILTQLRAVRAAVNTIEADILATHIDSCVARAMESGDGAEKAGKLVELKELYRRFNK